MHDAVVARTLGKRFRRYHADRPWTLHEALLRGFRNVAAAESFWSLRDVSFRLPRGSMTGVVGRNGAGKSTLLRLIGGVSCPNEGSVEVNGRVGALLNLGAGFHPELTGRENLYVSGVIGGLTRKEVSSRLDSIVSFAELEDYLDSPLRTYSSGMQMRLAFSIAVHSRPDVLLIDEVLAVGDIAFQRKCLDRIDRLKEEGCAILVVSHDVTIVQELCSSALFLRAGRLVAHGDPAEVVGQYLLDAGVSLETPAMAPAWPSLSGIEGPAHDRSGVVKVEIQDVRLLDSCGQVTAEIDSGDAVSVEIGYTAHRPVKNLNFRVHLCREDGVSCCEVATDTSASGLMTGSGTGKIILHIEHLDLNAGLYYIDVSAFERDRAPVYEYREKLKPLTVRAPGAGAGLLRPPHRWELRAAPVEEPPCLP